MSRLISGLSRHVKVESDLRMPHQGWGPGHKDEDWFSCDRILGRPISHIEPLLVFFDGTDPRPVILTFGDVSWKRFRYQPDLVPGNYHIKAIIPIAAIQ